MNAPFSNAGGHGRQAATRLSQVSPDHLVRYEFAAGIASKSPSCTILDAGCGVGYGSRLMAGCLEGAGVDFSIAGFDIEPSAIEHAKRYFAHDKIAYRLAGERIPFGGGAFKFDVGVCFEVIEHIEDPAPLLRMLAESCDLLLASVPNEDEYPFIAPPGHPTRKPGHKPDGHVRHYEPEQFEALLNANGWRVVKKLHQKSKADPSIQEGWKGRTLVVAAVPHRSQGGEEHGTRAEVVDGGH